MLKIKILIIITFLMTSSCGFKVSSTGSHSGNFISGIISPLLGSIAENNSSSYYTVLSSANASACVDPVYVKIFLIKTDGSIDETNPLASQLISSDARYSFDAKSIGILNSSQNIQYLVKAEGCNGDVYKRPITNFDTKQNIDAKSTVIAEVMNSVVTNKLNAIKLH